jgi:histidine triad (HIT) family protein
MAPKLADLTDTEARAVGWWCTQASRALRDVAGAEHVYSAVIGDRVPHLHVQLIPRYPGTPREFWWLRLDEWPGAKRGGTGDHRPGERPPRVPGPVAGSPVPLGQAARGRA